MAELYKWENIGMIEAELIGKGGPKLYTFDSNAVWRIKDGYRIWELPITRIVLSMVSDGMRCIDIGAECGYYSLLLSMLVGKNGMVYAIEPSRYGYEVLRRNVGDLDNVVTINAAVSDKVGILKYSRDIWEIALDYKRNPLSGIDGEVHDVSSITLDGFDNIDFIKCDADGWDPVIAPLMAEKMRGSDTFGFVEFGRDRLQRRGFDPRKYIHDLMDMFKHVYISYPSFYSIRKEKVIDWLATYPRYCNMFFVTNSDMRIDELRSISPRSDVYQIAVEKGICK